MATGFSLPSGPLTLWLKANRVVNLAPTLKPGHSPALGPVPSWIFQADRYDLTDIVTKIRKKSAQELPGRGHRVIGKEREGIRSVIQGTTHDATSVDALTADFYDVDSVLP